MDEELYDLEIQFKNPSRKTIRIEAGLVVSLFNMDGFLKIKDNDGFWHCYNHDEISSYHYNQDVLK